MHGIRRVLVFCTLTTILPTMLLVIPLYLRHSFYADVAYAVTESDILEVNNGISTIFCSVRIHNFYNHIISFIIIYYSGKMVSLYHISRIHGLLHIHNCDQ